MFSLNWKRNSHCVDVCVSAAVRGLSGCRHRPSALTVIQAAPATASTSKGRPAAAPPQPAPSPLPPPTPTPPPPTPTPGLPSHPTWHYHRLQLPCNLFIIGSGPVQGAPWVSPSNVSITILFFIIQFKQFLFWSNKLVIWKNVEQQKCFIKIFSFFCDQVKNAELKK